VALKKYGHTKTEKLRYSLVDVDEIRAQSCSLFARVFNGQNCNKLTLI